MVGVIFVTDVVKSGLHKACFHQLWRYSKVRSVFVLRGSISSECFLGRFTKTVNKLMHVKIKQKQKRHRSHTGFPCNRAGLICQWTCLTFRIYTRRRKLNYMKIYNWKLFQYLTWGVSLPCKQKYFWEDSSCKLSGSSFFCWMSLSCRFLKQMCVDKVGRVQRKGHWWTDVHKGDPEEYHCVWISCTALEACILILFTLI